MFSTKKKIDYISKEIENSFCSCSVFFVRQEGKKTLMMRTVSMYENRTYLCSKVIIETKTLKVLAVEDFVITIPDLIEEEKIDCQEYVMCLKSYLVLLNNEQETLRKYNHSNTIIK